ARAEPACLRDRRAKTLARRARTSRVSYLHRGLQARARRAQSAISIAERSCGIAFRVRCPAPHSGALAKLRHAPSGKGKSSKDLVVQRNALSGLPQWLPAEPLAPFFSPRAGVALTRPSIPRLPPGGDVQVALQRIVGRFRGQQDLQQPP